MAVSCAWFDKPSATPNSNAATNIAMGLPPDNMMAAKAMNPLPDVIFSENILKYPRDICARAGQLIKPEIIIVLHLTVVTETPTEEAAVGFSPQALIFIPYFVL